MINFFSKIKEDFIDWWIVLNCYHNWKPLVANNKPHDYCNMCDKYVELTEEQFFTKYGEAKYSQMKSSLRR